MRQLASLAWKEWNESRWLLFVALAVFLGLPAIGGLEAVREGQRFAILASPWVFYLGGVLAVFVGVDAACRDLRGRLEDFWRSRPVGTAKWLLVKYFLGLAVVLVACIVPLVAQIKVNRDYYVMPNPAEVMLAWCPFLWTALYSLGFVAGSVLRRGAHAAMLALAGMLLVYFLPVVLPPIERMSVAWVLETSTHVLDERTLPTVHRVPWVVSRVLYANEQLVFVAGMLALSAASAAVALSAARRGWHVQSGEKLMYWSVGSALLIVFTSAEYQLATNLPVVHAMGLRPGESVVELRGNGEGGIVFARRVERGQNGYGSRESNSIRTFRLMATGFEPGPPMDSRARINNPGDPAQAAWLPEHPDVAYLLHYQTDPAGAVYGELVTVSANPAAPAAPPLRLWTVDKGLMSMRQFAWQNRLYVEGARAVEDGGYPKDVLADLDIGDPLHPKLIGIESKRSFGHLQALTSEEVVFQLTRLRDVPERQLLADTVNGYGEFCIDGDIVCRIDHGGLVTYQRVMPAPWPYQRGGFAVFQRAGEANMSLLETLSNSYDARCTAGGGFCYVSSWSNTLKTPRVTVFDTRDPKRPRMVGHFAVPNDGPLLVRPLTDGRALIGGRKLYLVGPPPIHN
ncbi:MAG TPA: hypothetical protein VG269_22475 [Tepidisphaeraceae bacterium]|jgi:hypothetical protein|nr:hypothetical protein [Tepidisphaeraceae bacterium]